MRPVAPRALGLLVGVLETPGGRLVEDALEPDDHDAFRALRDCGALSPAADVPAIMCPSCGEHDVEPKKSKGVLQGLCPECSYVAITNASLKAWAADPEWLLERLRMAFGIASRQASEELVQGTFWKVCDHQEGRRSRRVLLTRRLSEHAVHRAFREALNEKVERDNAVIIATTPKSAAMVGDLSLPYVHLAEMVHWRSGKLELDKERWTWCLKPAHLRRHTANPVFYDGYRAAIVDGDEYTFSINQALVFEALDGERGTKRHGPTIMAELGSPQRNPGELFRHNARQWEGFSKLVAWDEAGFYWMKRA